MSVDLKIKRIYEKSPEAQLVINKIRDYAKKLRSRGFDRIKIMNFCGTHEWTITYYGIRSLMPENIDLIAGPGCPVCITPGYYVDILVKLSMESYVVLSYGDSYRLPGSGLNKIRSLFDARVAGGDTRIVYSFLDAVKTARENPGRIFIFFAVGFETTMPSTSYLLKQNTVPNNIFILSAYRLTPPVLKYLLDNVRGIDLSGVIAPGHVSSIIGAYSWIFVPKIYRVPAVVAGFEPMDVLLAILYILRMIYENKPDLVNEYSRVVKPFGNLSAKRVVWSVYSVSDSYWRGIGYISSSGAKHSYEYLKYDLFHNLDLEDKPYFEEKLPGCKCSEIVLGLSKPTECPLFLKTCTPQNPYGPCMVSIEGTCRIWAENLPISVDK